MGEPTELHVAVFPWLAFGHIMSFVQLSKSIAQKGHHISFISTPRNIDRLPKLPSNSSGQIDLVKFPMPHCEGLPTNAEATSDVPIDKIRYLKMALDGLEGSLTRFLEAESPDWIIIDFPHYWVPQIAAKFGVQCAAYSVFGAAALAFYGLPPSVSKGSGDTPTAQEDLIVTPKWIPFPSTIAFRLHEARKHLSALNSDTSSLSMLYRLGLTVSGCRLVAIRSCMDLEPEYIRLLEELYRIPVVPVGSLLPSSLQNTQHDHSRENVNCVEIFEWLDKQSQGSVIYVGFGSEVSLTREQVHELASGLKLSKLPFIWALRRGYEMLPEGFEDRINSHGIVCKDWVPQLRILEHSSVGGFLTHSGWGSIIEGLRFGNALILLPLLYEQGLNARLMVEKKMGVEVARNEGDGSFMGEELAKTLRLVMVEGEGEPFRAKARVMSEIFADKKRHDGYVDGLIKLLEENKHQPK